MTRTLSIIIDGRLLEVPEGITVAAAMLNAGEDAFRDSVSGMPRGAVCGMGICFECRVTIDGARGRRACLERVSPGMRVTTRE
ncbi:MAG TPA: (2Fe-2S)-binding protein [Gemmatimonadales bacterium]|nr:(2Fe-2S)-binding protein [Gemmatimonadales bacterium]